MMKNKKVCVIILIILIITGIYFISLLLFKYMNNIENEKQMELISNQILEQSVNNSENIKQNNFLTEINGYKIIGIIEIPAIKLKYPILEINNEQTMKIAITKFWGDAINGKGNLTLAGHNNLDGTMFGKLKKIKLQDEIKLTDLNKKTESYKVYNIYTTNPLDTSVVNVNINKKEVTLVTCSNGRKNRLIVKAES